MYTPKLLAKKSACTFTFGALHSNLLEIGTKIEIHNNVLFGKVEIYSFCLDIGRIGNFHFSVVPMKTLGLTSPVRKGKYLFLGGRGSESTM